MGALGRYFYFSFENLLTIKAAQVAFIVILFFQKKALYLPAKNIRPNYDLKMIIMITMIKNHINQKNQKNHSSDN